MVTASDNYNNYDIHSLIDTECCIAFVNYPSILWFCALHFVLSGSIVNYYTYYHNNSRNPTLTLEWIEMTFHKNHSLQWHSSLLKQHGSSSVGVSSAC